MRIVGVESVQDFLVIAKMMMVVKRMQERYIVKRKVEVVEAP